MMVQFIRRVYNALLNAKGVSNKLELLFNCCVLMISLFFQVFKLLNHTGLLVNLKILVFINSNKVTFTAFEICNSVVDEGMS
jgi:hypothetical protein